MANKCFLLVLLIAFAGCNQREAMTIEGMAAPEDHAFAKSQIDRLRQGKLEDIERDIDPGIKVPNLRDTLAKMASLIPPGEPTAITLVHFTQSNARISATTTLTYEYEFSGKWLIAIVAFKRQGDKTTIVGLNVYPQSASLGKPTSR